MGHVFVITSDASGSISPRIPRRNLSTAACGTTESHAHLPAASCPPLDTILNVPLCLDLCPARLLALPWVLSRGLLAWLLGARQPVPTLVSMDLGAPANRSVERPWCKRVHVCLEQGLCWVRGHAELFSEMVVLADWPLRGGEGRAWVLRWLRSVVTASASPQTPGTFGEFLVGDLVAQSELPGLFLSFTYSCIRCVSILLWHLWSCGVTVCA